MKGDTFKVKYGIDEVKIQAKTPNVSIYVDFSPSSLALVDILISWLHEQISMGPRAHVGFYLTLLCLNAEFTTTELRSYKQRLVEKYGGEEQLEKLHASISAIDCNSIISHTDLHKVFIKDDNRAYTTTSPVHFSTTNELLEQISDISSRRDLKIQLTDEIFARYCIRAKSSYVLLSDSMTELATKTLSFTAQGRGERIGEILGDTAKKSEVIYPFRDVLQFEIDHYITLCELTDLVIPKSSSGEKSVRNRTVNELIDSYFDSIQPEYPEVVSTVVKVGSKLSGPTSRTSRCDLCHKIITEDPIDWLSRINVNEGVPASTEDEKANLERYRNAEKSTSAESIPVSAKQISLCYGCTVLLKSIGSHQIAWPMMLELGDKWTDEL